MFNLKEQSNRNLPAVIKSFLLPSIFATFSTIQNPVWFPIEYLLLFTFSPLEVPIHRWLALSLAFLHELQVPVVIFAFPRGRAPAFPSLAPIKIPAPWYCSLFSSLFHKMEIPFSILLFAMIGLRRSWWAPFSFTLLPLLWIGRRRIIPFCMLLFALFRFGCCCCCLLLFWLFHLCSFICVRW